MKRDVAQLGEQQFDLAVVGGGVHGATIAALAAATGLSTVLLEKEDFCGGTSANSLKILHGGLRYLQHMDLPRIRDSIISRRWMMKNFPELVEPLQCIMPTSGRALRSKAAMAAGLFINDIFSCIKNNGVLPEKYLGSGRVVSRSSCAKIIKGLDTGNVSGGAIWYDALALNTERIVLELVFRLTELGGKAANYITVKHIAREGDSGVLYCADTDSGHEITVRAGSIVNTSGPWCGQFGGLQKGTGPVCKGWSRAINLIVKPELFSGYAVGLEGKSSFIDKDAVVQKGKRLFFFVPWRGNTMIGTVYTAHHDPQVPPTVTRKELEAMLDEINQIYPAGNLQYGDIVNYHMGLMPSVPTEDSGPFDVQLDKKEVIIDHGVEDGLENVFTVKTVKYTTAFSVACQFLECLVDKGILKNEKWKKKVQSPFADSSLGADTTAIPARLRQRYGRQVKSVLPYLSNVGDAQNCGGTAGALDVGEIRYAVEQEMALHLDDALLRRTDIATASLPSNTILEDAADTMMEVCGWSKERRALELERMKKHFQPLV